MPVAQTLNYKLIFSDGETKSSILQLSSTQSLQSLYIPEEMAGTILTVLGSPSPDLPLLPVYNSGNASTSAQPFEINYVGGRFVRLEPAAFYGMQYMQFISNAAQTEDIIVRMVIGVLT